MKLQISFDMPNLENALQSAEKIEQFADILEIGSPLIYQEGIQAIKAFRDKFPNKEIFADIKLVDRVEKIITNFSKVGANYISILAGTSNSNIQNSSKVAHSSKSKIALDLVDSYSIGQSAMDAKALDVDVIIFHGPRESTQLTDILEQWQNVRGNTELPIFVAGGINRNNIEQVITLKPQGVIVGATITNAKNPIEEAEYFKSLLKQS